MKHWTLWRPRSSDLLQKPAPSNGQGHPFTDPLRTPLLTQKGQSLSHSIHYHFTGAAEPITLHVSAPENDDALGGLPVKRFNLGDGTLHRNGQDKYFPPWILARLHRHKRGARPLILSPYSALISLALPRTSDMYWRALPISLQRARLCILARLRWPKSGAWLWFSTVPWCILYSTVHASCFSEGSSPNLSPDTSNKLYLEALESIYHAAVWCSPWLDFCLSVPAHSRSCKPPKVPNFHSWLCSAVCSYVTTYTLQICSVSTSSLMWMSKRIVPHKLHTFSATSSHCYFDNKFDYTWLFLLCFSRMTAIWARTHYKMSLRGTVKKILAGQWRSLYDSAINVFALKLPNTANNDPDHVQQRKNKLALILTKKGNLSKAYKALTQDGLVDHDALETLRKQHRREHMPPLDLHSSLTQDIQDNTDWSKLISADAI